MNTLYYGDNLFVLREHIQDESVDLVYLDPPFKSNQDYNVLFAEQSGERAAAQIMAFEDTWHWDQIAAEAFESVITGNNPRVADVMRAFETFLGRNDMLAYLSMMAPRLVELRRVLKPTGSIYLHCDPTASHYLKLLMDAVFGPVNFRSEVVWKRTSAHSDSANMGNAHDNLLYYTKGEKFLWNKQFQAYDESYIRSHYNKVDEKGRKYRTDNLTAMGLSGGGYEYVWNGVTKLWRCPKDTMMRHEKEGRIRYTRSGSAEYIRYLDEMPGRPLQDIWDDIPPINSQAAERLGYPTQKPEALLERIIQASSNEGDVVLDPFCGCGTAVAVAQKLNRKWIGIDITHLAMTLIKKRLKDSYNVDAGKDYAVVGEPVSLSGAVQLAEEDKFQFQWWSLGLVHARPVEQKKGADKGIDGRRYFIDGQDRHTEQIIFSVKGGHVKVGDVRDLRGVIEREKAAFGILLCMEQPTKPMRAEATEAGFYTSDYSGTKHPRLQILTIEELLNGKQPDLPALANVQYADKTFKKAPKAKKKSKGN
ncbi:restriction endonuclease [bacterium]|nr:restriction endonuclease [bacterium]